MKIYSLAAAILLSTLSVGAETFRLEDLFSDQKTGPLNFKHGTCITLDNADYQLIRIDPNQNEIIDQSKSTQFESLSFGATNSRSFIQEMGTIARSRGLDKISGMTSLIKSTNRNYYEFHNMSFYSTLNVIAAETEDRWSIRHGVIFLEPATYISVPVKNQTNDEDFSIFDPKSNRFVHASSVDKISTPAFTRSPQKISALEKTEYELFSLMNQKTGKKFGPFQLKNAEIIRLGDEASYIIKQDPKEAELVTSMKAVTLSGFALKNESIGSALRRLEESAESKIKFRLSKELSGSTETISCDLSEISLYNAVAMVCELSGYEWAFENDNVVFSKSPISPTEEPHPTSIEGIDSGSVRTNVFNGIHIN